MIRWLNRLQPWGILFLRIVLGVALLYHSWSKVIPAGGFHHGNTSSALEHYLHYVASLGLPAWLGYVSAFAEFVGGIMLILGLFTRFFAFFATIDMLVGIALVTLRHGYEPSEYPIALAAIAFLLLLTGPGKAALDRKIGLS
jgi:putative oxidoreductase